MTQQAIKVMMHFSMKYKYRQTERDTTTHKPTRTKTIHISAEKEIDDQFKYISRTV
jgi:hypothetical protein